MVDIFCTHCQHPHMDQRERLCHVPLGLSSWEEGFAFTPRVLVSGVLDMAVQLMSTFIYIHSEHHSLRASSPPCAGPSIFLQIL